jgi:hypothetical protein
VIPAKSDAELIQACAEFDEFSRQSYAPHEEPTRIDDEDARRVALDAMATPMMPPFASLPRSCATRWQSRGAAGRRRPILEGATENNARQTEFC